MGISRTLSLPSETTTFQNEQHAHSVKIQCWDLITACLQCHHQIVICFDIFTDGLRRYRRMGDGRTLAWWLCAQQWLMAVLICSSERLRLNEKYTTDQALQIFTPLQLNYVSQNSLLFMCYSYCPPDISWWRWGKSGFCIRLHGGYLVSIYSFLGMVPTI